MAEEAKALALPTDDLNLIFGTQTKVVEEK